jgi:hypothetical protein
VVTRHEVLRTVQVEAEGKPAQQVIPAAEAGVGFADEVPADRMATAATAAPAQALDPMATAATAASAQALDLMATAATAASAQALDLIVAVLTTLKAGGAYVPIHTACPRPDAGRRREQHVTDPLRRQGVARARPADRAVSRRPARWRWPTAHRPGSTVRSSASSRRATTTPKLVAAVLDGRTEFHDLDCGHLDSVKAEVSPRSDR